MEGFGEGSEMFEYPHFEHSMDEVRRAGVVISGALVWTDETAPAIREAFSIANSWRDAHAYPMRSIRFSLLHHLRHQKLNGFTAARLKRMQAIRRKLRRMKDRNRPVEFHELQDLGGCRAIMNTMEDVRALVKVLKERLPHDRWGEDDYISRPKKDGYRSHHLKFAFKGRGTRALHNGRRIEVQVRTSLQHSWATAVEAVGLVRGEDLKGSDGSENWLRLFRLMSAEFAEAEKCRPPRGLPDHKERMREIRELERELDAVDTLDNLSHAFDWNKEAVRPSQKPSHYLISYDRQTKKVTVLPYYKAALAAAGYDNAEASDNRSGAETSNVVLVEVDKLDNLERAYPNYFGDVQLFKEQLRQLTRGRAVDEYTVARQQAVASKPRENPDPSWIGRRGRWTEPKRRRPRT